MNNKKPLIEALIDRFMRPLPLPQPPILPGWKRTMSPLGEIYQRESDNLILILTRPQYEYLVALVNRSKPICVELAKTS